MENIDSYQYTDIQRYKFIEWMSLSSLALALPMKSFSGFQTPNSEIFLPGK